MRTKLSDHFPDVTVYRVSSAQFFEFAQALAWSFNDTADPFLSIQDRVASFLWQGDPFLEMPGLPVKGLRDDPIVSEVLGIGITGNSDDGFRELGFSIKRGSHLLHLESLDASDQKGIPFAIYHHPKSSAVLTNRQYQACGFFKDGVAAIINQAGQFTDQDTEEASFFMQLEPLKDRSGHLKVTLHSRVDQPLPASVSRVLPAPHIGAAA